MNCCNMPHHAMLCCKLGVANVAFKWLFAFVKRFHVISYAISGCESATAKVIVTTERFLLVCHLIKKFLLMFCHMNIHIMLSHLGRFRIQKAGRGSEAGRRFGGHHWAPGGATEGDDTLRLGGRPAVFEIMRIGLAAGALVRLHQEVGFGTMFSCMGYIIQKFGKFRIFVQFH